MGDQRWWIRLWVGLWCGAIAIGCQGHLPGSPFQGLSPPPLTEPAVMVMRVVSGQTLEIQGANATSANNETVCLIGVQAPAYGQNPWDDAVKTYLSDRLLGQPVQLEWDQLQQNDYGCKLAYVWLGEQMINQVLVADGYVMAVARSPNLKYDTLLKESQYQARLLGLGIWNPDQPMRQTPSEFKESSS